MTLLSGERGRWTAALLISLLIHCALFFVFGGAKTEKEPEPIMNVKLVFAPASHGNSGGGDGGNQGKEQVRPQPQKEKQAASVSQKVTVKKKKETPIKEISATPAKNKEIAAPAEPLTGVPDETAAEAGGGRGGGSGAGTGTGSGGGTGSGSGSGPGQGAGPGSGGGIADVNTLEVTHKVLPDYPAFSRKRREEGTSVIVAAVENGRVQSAEIEKSSGYDRLDNAALRAVKEWRFRHDGYIRVRVPFIFKIR